MNGALIEIEQEKKNPVGINQWFFFSLIFCVNFHGGMEADNTYFFSEKKIAKSTYVKVNLTRKRNEIAN